MIDFLVMAAEAIVTVVGLLLLVIASVAAVAFAMKLFDIIGRM